jgi:hypothetical protein
MAGEASKVLHFEAWKRGCGPEPKIGHIANRARPALARRRRPDLDRFSGWIAVQRTRLDSLRERLERAMVRPEERDGETRQGGQEQKSAEQSGSTPEQRDRLLGGKRDATDGRKPDRGDREPSV